MHPFSAFDFLTVTITFNLDDGTECAMDFEHSEMTDATNLPRQIRAVERLTGKGVTSVVVTAVTNRKLKKEA